MGNSFKRIIQITKNAVFPRFCVGCGLEGGLLCKDCNIAWQIAKINIDNANIGHISSFNYADPIARQLICAWKYHYDQSAWVHIRRKIKLELVALRHIIHAWGIEAVVPISLHKYRLCERGFDQAVEIAKFIADEMDLPMIEMLKRVRPTGKQAEREVNERVIHMQNNPFQFVNTEHKQISSVILVDDVWTTGATANAGVDILKQAGIKNILIYTLAKGK